MAQITIPKEWREQVCTILATEATGTLIEWTRDAQVRYNADSNASWNFELYSALQTFLSEEHPSGCRITMQAPPGETYEFYFRFHQKKFYGKIMLRADRKRILIFSAHLPLRRRLSCEE
jgi:hypothetical protein